MNCPIHKTPLTCHRCLSAEGGRKGGPTKARSSKQARKAALRRWEIARGKKVLK